MSFSYDPSSMDQFVVYHRPSDNPTPHAYCVRRWKMPAPSQGSLPGTLTDKLPVPGEIVLSDDDLEVVRRALRDRGTLIRIPRDDSDDQVIVETWV